MHMYRNVLWASWIGFLSRMDWKIASYRSELVVSVKEHPKLWIKSDIWGFVLRMDTVLSSLSGDTALFKPLRRHCPNYLHQPLQHSEDFQSRHDKEQIWAIGRLYKARDLPIFCLFPCNDIIAISSLQIFWPPVAMCCFPTSVLSQLRVLRADRFDESPSTPCSLGCSWPFSFFVQL